MEGGWEEIILPSETRTSSRHVKFSICFKNALDMGSLTFPPFVECPKLEILLKVNCVSISGIWRVSQEWRGRECSSGWGGQLQDIPEVVNVLKGIVHQFFFLLFKSYILGSNGVWYSWFWLEGSINAQNSTFLGFRFVPRDLDSRRHKGPRLAAPWGFEGRRRGFEAQHHGAVPLYYPKYEI